MYKYNRWFLTLNTGVLDYKLPYGHTVNPDSVLIVYNVYHSVYFTVKQKGYVDDSCWRRQSTENMIKSDELIWAQDSIF